MYAQGKEEFRGISTLLSSQLIPEASSSKESPTLISVSFCSQQSILSSGNGSSEVEVVPFHEVWGRSYCRTMEKLVDIMSEYPNEVEHIFSPSCVALQRCTGCCGDENLYCAPVKTANVTMQVLKIPPQFEAQPSYVELTFSQHVLCECSHSPRRQSWDMPGDCAACEGCALTGSLSWQQPLPCPWSCPSFTVCEETPRMHPGRKGRKRTEKMKQQRTDSKDPRFDAKKWRHAEACEKEPQGGNHTSLDGIARA
uniref:Platelet-derived growth factor (PDGF) family profile domain-containing protein n=1 Tax=Castor canadensis TaxID=51338 RepID=A0A8C0ZN69_CASCN